MNLTDYLESLNVAGRREFARRCGTSLEYLRQVASGLRKPKAQLAVTVSRESGGRVSVESLLPDVDWAYLRNPPLQEQVA